MPPRPRRRVTIGSIMAIVAGVAFVLANGSLVAVAAILLTWPLALWGLSLPTARWVGCSRLRAGVWLCSAFPWFALALVIGLTHGPARPSIPWVRPLADILRASLFWSLLAVPAGGLFLAFSELLLTVERGGPDQGRQVSRLVLIPMTSWSGSFLMLWTVEELRIL